jgi:hypothetical protein
MANKTKPLPLPPIVFERSIEPMPRLTAHTPKPAAAGPESKLPASVQPMTDREVVLRVIELIKGL